MAQFPTPIGYPQSSDEWLDLPDGAIVDCYFDDLQDDGDAVDYARAAQLNETDGPFGFLVSPESALAVDSLLHFCD